MTDHHALLLERKTLLHVSTSGSGPALMKDLWRTPGCSAYLVGTEVPYSKSSVRNLLGHAVDRYVTEDVAYELAMASYVKACEHRALEGVQGEPMGMGITSSVATSRLPRGDQRAHIVLVTKDHVWYEHLMLNKDVGEEVREEHDQEIAWLALALLKDALKGEECPNAASNMDKAVELFYRRPTFHPNGVRKPASICGLYVPVTMNPLHDGHRLMASNSEEMLSPRQGRLPATYLVSSVSPHKPPMTLQEMLDKVGTVRAERWQLDDSSRPIEFTRSEPLFLDKARARPGSTFVIGVDAMRRLFEPGWGVDVDKQFSELRTLKTKFLVMGRLVDGSWLTCRDIKVPWPNQLLFDPLIGRVDVSSTQLREAAQ
jgi:hypothetical protein